MASLAEITTYYPKTNFENLSHLTGVTDRATIWQDDTDMSWEYQ